ncbi:MAG: fasciclin domain-containing protein [Paludibacteraceae bacterium]|nr:fasciclin domain-containing protein [Paludibacteraceae bacterium]
MKQKFIIFIAALSILGSTLVSCDADKVDNLYTFTDKMLGQYLRDTTEYSEFVRLLDTTKVIGLLNSYGSYTVFAPGNDAMHEFYALKGKNSLADFSLDSLRLIAYDHIINGSTITYNYFNDGRLGEMTMSDRYISISFVEGKIGFVNKTSEILSKDILVHNGVIHQISEVINPTNSGIVEAISKDSSFTIFYEALMATALAEKLLKDKDDGYDPDDYKDLISTPKEQNQWFYHEIPTARKYGFTVLMESDETMRANNINNIDDLKAFAASVYDDIYPEDAGISDIKDRHNSLNRFIAYHIIEKQLSYTRFIDAYATEHMIDNRDMYEYIETLCPNTLMEVKKDRLANKTNLINFIPESGRVINISDVNFDRDATNGVYHEIDGMLVYDREVDNMLSGKRLRFDSSSFFAELTNNNMRGRGTFKSASQQNLHFQIPRGYIERIKASEQTVVGYLCGYDKFQNYQGDEIFLNASAGKLYDFEILTPPIPAGTYEVRFGYLTNGKRGVAQLYFDGIPCGVPLNLNKSATDNGYQVPGSIPEDPDGFENDKIMRNQGYMKGPACYKVPVPGWTSGANARYSNSVLRRILGTFTFTEAGHHTFTVKGLSGGEFMFDYMEFVPTSAIETEDIY